MVHAGLAACLDIIFNFLKISCITAVFIVIQGFVFEHLFWLFALENQLIPDGFALFLGGPSCLFLAFRWSKTSIIYNFFKKVANEQYLTLFIVLINTFTNDLH